MGKLIDLTGRKFGRLEVIGQSCRKNGKLHWLCRCDCGNEIVVVGSNLRTGNTTSCGCLSKDHPNHYKHGQRHTRLYGIWSGMKKRCYNQRQKYFKDYGGRGIIVCDEWINNFAAFRDWALSCGYQEDLSIDRIDVNGNYEPSNCRWEPMKKQQNNRRNNRIYDFNGESHTIAEWARIIGIDPNLLYQRLNSGWPIEKALKTPIRGGGKKERGD